jgi:hypothetical protein
MLHMTGAHEKVTLGIPNKTHDLGSRSMPPTFDGTALGVERVILRHVGLKSHAYHSSNSFKMNR